MISILIKSQRLTNMYHRAARSLTNSLVPLSLFLICPYRNQPYTWKWPEVAPLDASAAHQRARTVTPIATVTFVADTHWSSTSRNSGPIGTSFWRRVATMRITARVIVPLVTYRNRRAIWWNWRWIKLVVRVVRRRNKRRSRSFIWKMISRLLVSWWIACGPSNAVVVKGQKIVRQWNDDAYTLLILCDTCVI